MTGIEADHAAQNEHEARAKDPAESRWEFEQGDEIVPGLSAIKKLGGGFRYEAYLAWSETLRSLVVTKVVRPGLVDDDRTLSGLADEIGLLERLAHPVLLRSFGHDLEGPRPHIVLEHLEGPRLSSLVRRYGPLQPEQLVPLSLQLCAAVHYLGQEGVVHLDVKPSNIIMGGPPRLIDLSVARTIEECGQLRSAVGTDGYMAPEQCLPRGSPRVAGGIAGPAGEERVVEAGRVGPAADVWGIGVTLFRAACGERPFGRGEHDSDVPQDRWPQLVEDPAELGERVPAEIAAPVMACLRWDPDARPAPGEVGDELELVLDGLPGPRLSRLKPRVRI